MNGDIREFLNTVGKIGWTMVGYDGNNHLRLHHAATGHFHSVAFTPSDYRSRRNSLAILERLAGRKIPRPNAAHYRHSKQPITAMQRSDEERRRSEEINNLVAEADELHQVWDALVHDPRPEDVPEARRIVKRYEYIRAVLAARHRIIEGLQ